MTEGASDSSQTRRGGRPPSRKRGTFTFRVTIELRAQLEAAAAKSGRPVSEEIEARLESSFKEPEIVYKTTEQAMFRVVDVLKAIDTEKFGGVEGQYAGEEFGKAFSYSIKEVEALIGGPPWHQDAIKIEEVRRRMRRAPDIIIGMVLDRIRLQNETPEEIAQRLGLDITDLGREEVLAALSQHFEKLTKAQSSTA